MSRKFRQHITAMVLLLWSPVLLIAQEKTGSIVAGTGPGWVSLGEDDFERVNSDEDTWTFRRDEIHCTGKPVSVMRTKKQYTNLEIVCEWRHMKDAGNSGIFLWTIPESLERLKGPGLPHGIEVEVLDLGYKTA